MNYGYLVCYLPKYCQLDLLDQGSSSRVDSYSVPLVGVNWLFGAIQPVDGRNAASWPCPPQTWHTGKAINQ